MVTPLSRINSENITNFLDDDNKLVIPLCENLCTIMKKCIDPYEDEYVCYDRNDAPIIGLFTKIFRCYKECVLSFSKTKTDCIYIYPRIIYEAYIKICYLIKYGEEARRKYRLISYRNRYNHYKETKESELGYDKVRNSKFLYDLADDDFDLADLGKNRQWKLDGKEFRQLMNNIEQRDDFYVSLYGIGSDSIHSDWADIRQLYLMGNEQMCGNLAPFSYHFRGIIYLTDLAIDTTNQFIDWEWTENKDATLIPLKEVVQELYRVITLIKAEIINIYENNPDKYMKE